ncbi:MAG TPA: YihY/virulence factor BrkB family protein, partial [Miltoncostaeaceae bacterium]|nr:YihY/virulence factor BrkB family protein [Miltoncostaeaceae bacterium]
MNDTPESPTDIEPRGWWAVLKRTARRFRAENRTDWAAALTYYAVLSLFPALIVLVAILGLVGQQSAIDELLQAVEDIGSPQAAETIRGPLEGVVENRGGAGALLGIGLAGALWSASGYIGAFTRAGNQIWQVEEGRPFWKLKPFQILVTAAAVLMLSVIALALVLTGPLAEAVGDAIGLGDAAVLAWQIGKWPVMALLLVLLIAMVYYLLPNVRQPRFRWLSPGAAVALVAWLVASAGFALYVANFGSYNATYGTLGGAILLL